MCVFVVATFGFVDGPLVPVLNPTLKFLDFVGFAGGITLYQRVNSTDIVWIDCGVGVYLRVKGNHCLECLSRKQQSLCGTVARSILPV